MQNISNLKTLYVVVEQRLLVLEILSKLAWLPLQSQCWISVVQLDKVPPIIFWYVDLFYFFLFVMTVCAVDQAYSLLWADLHTVSPCTPMQSVDVHRCYQTWTMRIEGWERICHRWRWTNYNCVGWPPFSALHESIKI